MENRQIRFCPFCKTGTYYDGAAVEAARSDGTVRVNCAFCKLRFWPGTKEDIERNYGSPR